SRWSFGFGFGGNGGYFEAGYNRGARAARVRHVHSRVPYYTKVWVPAAHERRIVGYDSCHRPIFRTVCVRPGFYRSVIAGYHCSDCRVRC
ncbi:MAG TPA: hypothetical protein VMT52_04990, partial [Planctomycetota bacterium]|nr:hypothetical protein [Planctomycetota bacterium]